MASSSSQTSSSNLSLLQPIVKLEKLEPKHEKNEGAGDSIERNNPEHVLDSKDITIAEMVNEIAKLKNSPVFSFDENQWRDLFDTVFNMRRQMQNMVKEIKSCIKKNAEDFHESIKEISGFAEYLEDPDGPLDPPKSDSSSEGTSTNKGSSRKRLAKKEKKEDPKRKQARIEDAGSGEGSTPSEMAETIKKIKDSAVFSIGENEWQKFFNIISKMPSYVKRSERVAKEYMKKQMEPVNLTVSCLDDYICELCPRYRYI